MNKPLLVVKFGTSAITNAQGVPDDQVIDRIATELSQLHSEYSLVLVSSGAVGAGKSFISNYDGRLAKRKAAAAVGNPLLIVKFKEAFAKHGFHVAQSLCERRHFAQRELFLQLKETYQELWANDIIPVANENDVISDRELKFSDNDELATLIAAGFGAEQLMIATEAGGLLDKDKNVVNHIKEINDEVMDLVDTRKSTLGLGGMSSKLTFAKLATKMGIKVTIFGIKMHQGGILKAFKGESGTTFDPQAVNLSARNKWLASGGLTTARIVLDGGAVEALRNRKSLLAVGIKKHSGDFDKGEVVELLNEKKEVIGVARTRVSSDSLDQNKQSLIVAHADDIAIL
ncbi:glutamate 5-kinase [Jiulongibacter sediminis]|uniref:Glutamate 5-kinase n=1 Tax=Jiulongibacter sediminis TaxID=1605367 RepID=A0A0P7C5I4_9BACT|nr:glutamate 5-kinase [Jiulongibacter sediminis]KPM50051.1 glutamate 5-kinase [Jiulongibacter sediminis]TBX27077.1 glutamate 5-kinase [Jiulongibacter sediminis]